MSGYRPIYTREEDIFILKAIIETKSYYKLKGRAFWEDVSNSGYADRTWQSLKERFEKHILPRINDYEITDEQKKMILLSNYQQNSLIKIESDVSESDHSDTNSDENDEEVESDKDVDT